MPHQFLSSHSGFNYNDNLKRENQIRKRKKNKNFEGPGAEKNGGPGNESKIIIGPGSKQSIGRIEIYGVRRRKGEVGD